jgi:3-hydroxybutyryl-CoA dehydrogenase
MQEIGIIGAGQMGRGIAQVCLKAGYHVILHDINTEQCQHALNNIRTGFEKWVSKGDLPEQAAKTALANLRPSTEIESLKTADLIIEAATEIPDIKMQLLQSVSRVTKPNAYLASNTSSISITRLATATAAPQRFIGIHFMNPVPRMPLVEIIRGLTTDDATFAMATDFVQKIGKQLVVSQDRPGFLVNRILIPMINEAFYTLYEGVGSAQDIDQAMVLGTNQPMGPLTLADFIGLDTCLSIMRVLHNTLGDDKYRPCPLLIQYVEAGWLGRKTQRGVYTYS